MRCDEIQREISQLGRFPGENEGSPSIDSHLADCESCRVWAEREAAFDQRCQSLMREVPIPLQLHEKLRSGMENFRRARQRSRVFVGVLAAAAALFLFITGFQWWNRPLNLSQLHSLSSLKSDELDQRYKASRMTLTSWANSQGIHIPLPNNLKYENVTAAFVVESNGVSVPTLEFKMPGHCSRIYLFPMRHWSMRQAEIFAGQMGFSQVMIPYANQACWIVTEEGKGTVFVSTPDEDAGS